MEVQLTAYTEFELPIPTDHAAFAYLFEGRGAFGPKGETQSMEATRMLVFNAGEAFRAESEAGMRFLLMAGAPFNEPVAPYGPFVMNTAEEIQQAFADLRNGTFVEESAI